MSKDETKTKLTVVQPIKTVGELRSFLENFTDDCKISNFYIPSPCGEVEAEVKFTCSEPGTNCQKAVNNLKNRLNTKGGVLK